MQNDVFFVTNVAVYETVLHSLHLDPDDILDLSDLDENGSVTTTTSSPQTPHDVRRLLHTQAPERPSLPPLDLIEYRREQILRRWKKTPLRLEGVSLKSHYSLYM